MKFTSHGFWEASSIYLDVFGKLPHVLLLDVVRRLLLLEISSIFIDVKIISVLCINVILVLEIHGIDTFSKILILKNDHGSIQGKTLCQ